MRVASIDIGTNTILMLIADLSADGSLSIISDEQVVARVGKGLNKTGVIEWDAFTRSERFLSVYLEKARQHNVDVLRCTGTSALRDAKNREDYLEYMHQKLHMEIEILTGDDEALWGYGGAISGFSNRSGRFAVLDIGGGSTELTIGEGFRILQRKSIDIGCVRLTEKFLLHSPPTAAELEALLIHIDDAINAYPSFNSADTTFVGVAGTVTTLAAVELGLGDYDRNAIAGFHLTREMIERRYDQFCTMSSSGLEEVLRIDPGRADIILVGVAILKRIVEIRDIPAVIVSERGLRYGIAMREWERGFDRSSIS
jgi:exopolyphosphatase/guanosine-5'-triphosphate,3'-diphosphate pyrophosphatase